MKKETRQDIEAMPDVQPVTVRLDREVHDSLRRWSFENRKPISEAIRVAVNEWLTRENQKRGKK